jgi:ferredoxin-NADP reductase
LLTAGVGITPALSMLRESYDLGDGHDLVLLHSQRRAAEVPYGEEVAWMARQLPGLRVYYVCSDPGGSTIPAGPRLVAGRLGVDVLKALAPDAPTGEVLICGPDSYRSAARSAALAVGCAPERIHEEAFTTAGQALAPSSAPPATNPPATNPPATNQPATDQPSSTSGSRSYRVQFRDHGVTVDCPGEVTILDAATAVGLPLPASCTQGLCGTCKSTLVTGEVDMRHNGGIRPREVAAGKVLLCCSRPLSDLVIAS